MLIWIAVAATCSSPMASDCTLVTYPQSFVEAIECQTKLSEFINMTRLQGLVTTGACHRIKVTGEFL